MIDWTAYAKEKKIGATSFPAEFLVNYSGDSILDIGCGTGKHLAQLRKKKLKVGIEVTIEWFKRKIDSDAKYLLASAFELPFKSQSFDTVLMIDVIEHLKFPSDALQEIK
ncbi:MAG: class I SAM-dependent methyltransferase, partial [Desulfobacterales bacterium]